MKARSFVFPAIIVVGVVVCYVTPHLIADDGPESVVDNARLGNISKVWMYPANNTLSIKPGIGTLFPLHAIVTHSDDGFEKVCEYYARKCGSSLPHEMDLVESGETDNGTYLVRDDRTNPRIKGAHMIFMHHGKDHNVAVVVMRPEKPAPTQIDILVSVR